MREPLDRRAFLALMGGAGAALTGCAASAKSGKEGETPAAEVGATGRRRPTRHGPRSLQQTIRGHVFTRGAPGFAAAAHVFNTRFDGVQPALVARPIDARDVRDAIRFTVAHGLGVRARSGGHSYAGYSTIEGGVMLDLRRLNQISVDKRSGTARIGAGAQLIDIYSTLAAHGATIPGGSCPSVGISGVTLGGGMGLAGRRLGLTLDSLVAAEIVTADGSLQTVSRREDPDLFWALRGGGGGNFGVVTSFTFRLHPMPVTAAYFSVSWPWSVAADALDAWQSWAPHATDRVTSILHLNSTPSISASGQLFGSSAELPGLLGPLLAVPGASLSAVGDLPYVALQQYWAGCFQQPLAACHTVGAAPGGAMPRVSFNAKSDYVSRPMPAAARAALIGAVATPGAGAVLFDCYGGALNRVASDATAFVHREQLFCMQYYGDGPSAAWIGRAWRAMRPYVSGQAYQNYIDPSLTGWEKAYYGRNLKRLEQIRKQVDPHHYFNFPQAIGR
ncbi:MAG: FAD-binding oxidoreductase [Solirubrobacteraceae bacterium]